jgi:lipopolysaccharide transport system permease protein
MKSSDAFGIAWAVMHPFRTMIVFTIIFGRTARLPAPARSPMPCWPGGAMLPGQFFTTRLTHSRNSLVGNVVRQSGRLK